MNKAKVIKTTFKMFTSADYKEAKKSYEDFVKRESKKVIASGNTTIACYFNDDEDTYKVAIIEADELVKKDLYSWDEVSTLLYENM